MKSSGSSGGSGRGARAAGRGAHSRQLRIIAGRWRGRRWRFAHDAIRPTPDRVRETLFNWLQAGVAGRRCLDLFAGAGSLGLEALSRGAASVDFIDNDARVIASLRATLAEFGGAGQARLFTGDALDWLRHAEGRYDLVFIDPPYAGHQQAAAADLLAEHALVGPGSRVYIEAPRAEGLPQVPAGWQALKAGAAGEVGYHLFGIS